MPAAKPAASAEAIHKAEERARNLANSTDAALGCLNEMEDAHLGSLESFAELLAHVANHTHPAGILPLSALAALATAIERHVEGVAEGVRTAQAVLREAKNGEDVK